MILFVARKQRQSLILFSVDNKTLYSNYTRTVETPVPAKKLHLTGLPKTKSRSAISIWGLNPTKENEKIWNLIKPNDIALFFRNGKYFAKATIIRKMKDEKIPSLLWAGDIFGKSMSLLIVCENITPINIDFDSTIPFFVNPTMPQAYFFPIKRVDDDKIDYLLGSFGSIESVLAFLSGSENESDPLIDNIESLKIADNVKIELKSKISKQRRGQNIFRKNVLLNYGNTCAVCEINDNNLLEAGHIIPVIKQEFAGRMENGICLCVLHHTMFDKGYFSFDDEYKIVISKQREINPYIRNMIFDGKRIRTPKIFPSKEFLILHRTKFRIMHSHRY